MANIANDSQYTLVSGTADNDYIKNTGAYASVYGYAGSDTIYNTNISHWSFIDAGAGNDSIYSDQGNYLTIRGGTGDDTIRIKSLYSNSHVIQYYSGDGNDYFIDEWDALTPNWTLEIGDGSGTYSTQTSGNDVIVTVGEGKITLANMASKSINIAGSYSSGSSSSELSNSNSNTLVSGTSEGDIITNQGNYVTIDAGAGNDSITNYGTDPSVTSFSVGKYAIILAGAGQDSVDNSGAYAIIDGGAGDDYILNTSYGTNSTITGGAGDDSIRNSANAKIYGGAGDDTITNTNLGANSTISGDAGNDYITTYNADNVSINGGAGADNIELRGSADDITVEGGTGNDFINIAGGSNLIKYSNGDGKDLIYGFNDTSTLSIASGSYTSKKSGSDVIVTVGDGKISLIGAATLDAVNISGTKASTISNTWKLSGTTATYGTAITITGVKSTSGLSISGKVVTVSKSAVNASKITISDGYTLKLASDVTKTSTKNSWSLSGTTATYKQTTKAGYKLASDAKSISYSKAATKTLVTVSGVKSTNGLLLNGKVVTVSKAALGTSKVTVSSGYTLALDDDVATSSSKKEWSKIGTTAKYNQTNTAGYTLASDAKSISYSKAATKTLATVTGVKSTSGLKVNGKVITVSKAALGTSKVTVSNGYTLALADDVAKASNKKAWSKSGTTATYKQTSTAGYTLASDAKSISYTAAANKTLATVKGVKSTRGFTLSSKTIKLATASLSKNVSVSGSYAFEFASNYNNAKITGSTSNDTIKVSGVGCQVSGGKGNDTLTGGSGADVFVYAQGDGNDVITNYAENDKISLKSGTAKISTSGDNVVFTVGVGKNQGKITLQKAKGKNITYIEDGKENVYPEKDSGVEYNAAGTAATLTSRYSKDTFAPSGNYKDILVTINAAAVEQPLKITGNKKKNRIIGTSDDDAIYGETGGDTITGGDGNDQIYGNAGNDSLLGGAGDDSLWGGAGSDILVGGAGDDSLWGGASNDTLFGGDGDDTFIYKSGEGKDTIADFEKGDRIMILSGLVNSYTTDNKDVIFDIDNAKQLVVKDASNKVIQLVDSSGNKLKGYMP